MIPRSMCDCICHNEDGFEVKHIAPCCYPDVEPVEDLWVCAGCGDTAWALDEGWVHTDAPWCHNCSWLA
jgi:hypothetical protein